MKRWNLNKNFSSRKFIKHLEKQGKELAFNRIKKCIAVLGSNVRITSNGEGFDLQGPRSADRANRP